MEIRFELLPLPNYYTAPAHPHATDAAVYTALLCRDELWARIQKFVDPLQQFGFDRKIVFFALGIFEDTFLLRHCLSAVSDDGLS